MGLQKCANDMDAHTDGWNLREYAEKTSEAWLKDCLGILIQIRTYLKESNFTLQKINVEVMNLKVCHIQCLWRSNASLPGKETPEVVTR